MPLCNCNLFVIISRMYIELKRNGKAILGSSANITFEITSSVIPLVS